LPKIERSEQQEWTEQTVEETFKVTFPNSGIIPLPKFLKAVADAHNATLAGEGQRREQAERERDGARDEKNQWLQSFQEAHDQLLSTQAVIAAHNKDQHNGMVDCYPIETDLSLLHQHDAEQAEDVAREWFNREVDKERNELRQQLHECQRRLNEQAQDTKRFELLESLKLHVILDKNTGHVEIFHDPNVESEGTFRQAVDNILRPYFEP